MDVSARACHDRPRILADGTIVRPNKVPKDDIPLKRDLASFSISSPAPPVSAAPADAPKPDAKPESKPPRRFAPQLVETSTKQRRGGNNTKNSKDETKSKDVVMTGASRHMPRRFAPQLISTAKRSFRQGQAVSPGHQYPNHMKPCPKSADTESRYSYASLVRRYESKRRHSFQVPELPAIESQSSDESPHSPDSVSTSPTIPSNYEKTSKGSEELLPEPEHFTQSAVAFLRDQALAAFPNERVHQPVSHFAIDRPDEDSSQSGDEVDREYREMLENLTAFRRGSTLDLGWELEELRHHKQEAEMRARDRMFAQGHTNFSAAAIAARQTSIDPRYVDEWAKEMGVEMERAVSPPILGEDITFVRCESPVSFLNEAEPSAAKDDDGEIAEDTGLWSYDRRSGNSSDGGLWHGTCKQPSQHDSKEQTGLATPSPSPSPRLGIITPALVVDGKELGLPFQTMTPSVEVQPPSQLPNKPCKTSKVVDNMDEMLAIESEIQKEFHDGFITQIFNYLSLGYPCLARDFDEELSKISGIPVEELRKDDLKVSAPGHLTPSSSGTRTPKRNSQDEARKDESVASPRVQVTGPGGDICTLKSGPGENANDTKCIRWTALKLYIHEWARQQPRMSEDNNAETWGALERRGSWGI